MRRIISDKTLERVCYLTLAISALAALWAMTRALDKPLLGPHSFRQTQTAISTYYMAQDPRMFFNYITPVLGKPWQIPMEVPFYQWAVARFHNFTGYSLDASGRIVSIAAWFACLVPLWSILRALQTPKAAAALGLSIMFSSPLYLFWGQAFLIETTGLLFSLTMVACALRGVEKKSWGWLVAALLTGVLASLCKVTTWALACGAGGLLLLFADGWPNIGRWKWLISGSLALGLPLIPAKIWLQWADHIKTANPFARELIIATSTNQSSWNFGTAEQKLSLQTWSHILGHANEQILRAPWGAIIFVLIILAGGLLAPKEVRKTALLLCGFLAGPIVFTNLYFEHSYYWIANSVWFYLAIAVSLGFFWGVKAHQSRTKIVAILLAICVAAVGFSGWFCSYAPLLISIPTKNVLESSWVRPLQSMVPPERTVLILGNDWNPNSLYYAERKGIAFPTAPWIPLPGPQLTESLAKLGPSERIGAVLVNPSLLLPENRPFFEQFFSEMGISGEGTQTAFGILFPALDTKYGGLPQ